MSKARLNTTATILFSKEIEADTLDKLAALIAELPNHVKTLHLLISTGGGTVMHGIAAYNLLKSLPHTVITHNIGDVNSIGIIMFLAGKKRYASPLATFMIHGVKAVIDEGKYTRQTLGERLASV